MQMRLELIPLPVSDVDRAIAFYADKLGFKKDFDVQPSEGVRVVQLTPEGSGCSVGFGTGLDVYAGEPGSVRGLHLVVEDITEARAAAVRRIGRATRLRRRWGDVDSWVEWAIGSVSRTGPRSSRDGEARVSAIDNG